MKPLRLLLIGIVLAARLAAAVCDDPGVRVLETRQGDIISLTVETTNCLDITLTLTATTENMRSSQPLPLTLETSGESRVALVTLRPDAPGQPWRYSYRYQWRYGGRGGQPDGTVYELPFAAGTKHTLIQGYRGTYSHQARSPNEYAHDWEMPVGTPVLAARDGVVVGVRQDSTSGGPSADFNQCANYVIVRHADGTYAEYLHLQANGVRVQQRDAVKAGQLLALSGNTGFSSAPHLHFAVFRAIDGNSRESLPVKFRTRDGSVQRLMQGARY